MAKDPTIATEPSDTQRVSPWTRIRGHWGDFRASNDLSWPRSPVVNWMLGLCLAIVVAVALFLAWFDWDMLRGPIARYASGVTGRNVRIDGHLHAHLLSWTPTVTVGGLKIGNPRWAGPGDTVQVGQSMAQVRLAPLFFGQLDVVRLEVDRPDLFLLKDAQGRMTWNLNPDPHAKPGKAPPIHTLIVRDGQVRFIDVKGHATFTGRFTSSDTDTPDARSGFHFTGVGNLHRDPFRVTISGGPIVHIQHDRPYAFDADVHDGLSHLTAHGQLSRPFDLNHVTGRMKVSGPDLSALYFLTGVAMPNTPTYALSGAFSRDGKRFALTALSGRVGDSDLRGDLSVDSISGRPFVKGDLHSRTLVFDDLAALFGGGARKASASPTQQAIAVRMQAEHKLLPDATLNVESVRSTDADVRYRAETVRARFVPLRSIQLRVRLDHGLLTVDPLTADFTRGTITGRVAINARGVAPTEDVDLRATNIRIEDFMAKVGKEQALSGAVLARVRLHSRGNSVHAAAAASNGGVTIVVPHGEIRKAFAELAGINVVKGLMLLWGKNEDRTDLRCAVAHFDVQGGVMRTRRLVFDTTPVMVDGTGTINLGSEAVDLELKGHAKKFSVGHLSAPIEVRGQLAAPHFGVNTGKVATQAGIGVGLGVLLSPLAAILPFVDPGLTKNADCAGLMAEQAATKAPVKAAARAR